MKKILIPALIGIFALCSGLVFGEARGSSWPGSALIFPYWEYTTNDKFTGLDTFFRITNTAPNDPDVVALADEALYLHIWFMNLICNDQNFLIKFTPQDSVWLRVRDYAQYGPAIDHFTGLPIDGNQGWAIAFATDNVTGLGRQLIAWDFFVGEGIVQHVGEGWAFAYPAITAESTAFPMAYPPTGVILDTDPPAITLPVIPGSPRGVFQFLPGGPHYLPLCTPSWFTPQYINNKKVFKYFTGNADPNDDLIKKYLGTKFVVLPWDGIFDASTQIQNCYFWSTYTYDYNEWQISSAYTLVRCWAVCDIDHVTQSAMNRSAQGYGWTIWGPNPTVMDFPSNTRICNRAVNPLSSPCIRDWSNQIYRPWNSTPAAITPADNYMGAFVLQMEKERVDKYWERPGPGLPPFPDYFLWAFYSPSIEHDDFLGYPGVGAAPTYAPGATRAACYW